MALWFARWNALPTRTRAFAGSFVLAAIGAIAFAVLLQRDTRTALFASPLRTEQVAEVVARLAEWNVAFVELPDNVRVDARRRNDLLLRLSVAGVPHAHLESSVDAMTKAGPLTPQSVLDAQQRDGLAGDLASGLRGMAGIDDARVIIAPAQAGAFADETSHAASASVRVTLQPNATLQPATLDAIRAFVAAGVPGLEAGRVAILDDRGLALGDGAAGAGPADGNTLERSLQSALDLAFGAGASIVRVRASYDARVRRLHDVVRKPLGSREIGTTTSDEHYTSSSKTYGKTASSVDRGSEVADENIDTPSGRLERISVAVAVDASRHLDLAKIRSLATGTLGLLSSRGDSLSVEDVVFARPPAPQATPYAAAFALLATLGPAALLAFAIACAARFGAKPAAIACAALADRLAIARTTRVVAAFAPAHVRGTLLGEPPHTAAAIISALPAATATAVLELYPPDERAAIVRRMSRAASPVVPDFETVLRRG